MFSGLTNQVSNWMGKKQETESVPEEENATGNTETSATLDASPVNIDEKKDVSPTNNKPTGGSRLEMFGNIGGSMKNQMSSWLGSGISGLNKSGTPKDDAEIEKSGTTPVDSTTPVANISQEDDNSSATGGADSDPGQISDTSPTEENQAGFSSNVSNKAIAGAKSFGSFLYSAASKAGSSVKVASAKIKKTVEDNSLIGELNKEQEAFLKEKEQGKSTGAAVPPWVGKPNQEALKQECLSLSTDRRNFVRAPPAGVDYKFDFDQMNPVALATLAEDPNLEKMRYELVPKVISEETFWYNYFYRVGLICQAHEVSSLAQEGSGSIDKKDNAPKDSKVPLNAAINLKDSGDLERVMNDLTDLSPSHHEFVSDSFTASSAEDLEEVRRGMKKLGIDLKEEEWEKELEEAEFELKDYELVNTQGNKELEDLEDALEHDLK